MAAAAMTLRPHKLPIPVGSNEGKVALENLDWLRPTSKGTPISEMCKRLKEDGYLFVKSLIPREDVLKVRSEYFTRYAPTGILEPGTSTEAGIFNSNQSPQAHGGIGAGELPPTDLQVTTMTDAHKAPEYLNFVAHTDLRSFIRNLMRWDNEVLLQRTMLRHNVPDALSTAVHYDKLFLRGRSIEEDFTRGAAELTPEERISAFNVHMEKYGQLSQNAAEFGAQHKHQRWLVTNYEAGDVVFHDPYMIHTSSLNKDTGGRIRLSTDLRFYREGSDLDPRWMKFWAPGDGL